ncbi:uncharacterized protein G2W53_016618 [Senna tora]|uniref:Uncharacterized protein n=1 Tax=Senna tora TaxID=362788 RepID=A0A834WQD0_9FABA|nr:uncharacterized protein G2W53_016618 [Senna tora]
MEKTEKSECACVGDRRKAN